MEKRSGKNNLAFKEFLFQLMLHVLVFIFYVIDNPDSGKNHSFHFYDIVFFLNYVLANVVISYVLLPKFYYTKKYFLFFGLTTLVIGFVILLEELGIEKLFFPDSRGIGFPGILFSLGEVLPVIVILSGFKFAWDALTKQRELEALQAIIQESELEFLKSQINPQISPLLSQQSLMRILKK